MRKSIILLPVLFIAGGASGYGAAPVARVISTEPIVVDGITAPARNYFPVGLGADVSTGSASAVLQFPDGTSLVLDSNSKLKIAGPAGKPEVRLIRGSARYVLAPNFRGSVSGGGRTDTAKTVDYAFAQPGRLGQSVSLSSATAMYLGSVGQSAGVIAPSSAISTGSFAAGNTMLGVFIANPRVGGSGPQIILPGAGGAQVINLTAHTDPVTQVVTYTVASISQTVILPGGGTQVITVSNNALIGTTVGGISGATPSGSTAQITFTAPGTSTPLPATQVATAITAVQTTALTQTPAGSTAPAATSVSTGVFSSSAP